MYGLSLGLGLELYGLLLCLSLFLDVDPACCDTCYGSVVCPSVCVLSVTLVHPAKATGQNEMPFGRDSRVVQKNIVLDIVL